MGEDLFSADLVGGGGKLKADLEKKMTSQKMIAFRRISDLEACLGKVHRDFNIPNKNKS